MGTVVTLTRLGRGLEWTVTFRYFETWCGVTDNDLERVMSVLPGRRPKSLGITPECGK